MKTVSKLTIALLLCGSLAACGGSGGSGDDTSTVSLRVTDAPIDDAVSVVLQFIEVRLRNTDGAWTSYPVNPPRSIDLLSLQGTNTADLLVDEVADVGEYDEIRLLVDSTPMMNFIDLGNAGKVELKIPSGSSSGLKIKGDFSVLENRSTSLVLDFDLRRSITIAGNSGNYILKPVIRLINDADAGSIRGTVDSTLLSDITACSDADPNTYNAVYAYTGHNVTPDDIDLGSNQNVEPYATTSVAWDDTSMTYLYEIAFLPAGDYTVALTCNADAENLDDGNDDLKFFNIRNVTVVVNNTLFL